MQANLLIKSLTGMAGVLGGACCAIFLPSTVNSVNSNEANNFVVSQITSSDIGSQPSTQHTFDEIGNSLNQNYQQKQNRDEGKPTVEELPWKNQLRTILSPSNPSSQKTWSLIAQEGENCLTTVEGKSTDCGYIHLSDQNFNYKLKINYEYLSQKGQGRIYIARKQAQEKTQFYDINNGKDGNVDFENLSSIKQGDSRGNAVGLAFNK